MTGSSSSRAPSVHGEASDKQPIGLSIWQAVLCGAIKLLRLIGLVDCLRKQQQHGSMSEQVPRKKVPTAQERQCAVLGLDRRVQQPAAAKAVPTVSAVGLSGATLSGLEQLEAQEVDDEYDPLILVGCVLEVPAWPYSGV